MSDRDDSLVLGNGAQLQLLEVDDAGLPADAYMKGEAAARFTGERIFSGNPRLYNAIVRLLGRGVPYREISEICSVGLATVCAVSAREGIPIESIRERVGRLALDVAAMSIEGIRDFLADPENRGKLSLRDLSIAFGIATQNAQLLLGGATARIETLPAEPTHEAYLEMLRNVTPTRSSGEPPAQKVEPLAITAEKFPAIDVPAPREDPARQPPAEGAH